MTRITALLSLVTLAAAAIASPALANLIDDTVDAAEDAYDSTASWVDGAVDTVSDTTEDAYDTVASATGSIDDVSSAQALAVTSAAVFTTVGLAVSIL